MTKCALLSLFGIYFGSVLVAGATEPPSKHVSKMSYLRNDAIRVGVDLNLGGAITYVSAGGEDHNIVNNFDWGRQIQMSYYSGPVPYEIKGKKPAPQWKHIGWNPVQSGDDYGNPSKVIESKNDGKMIYIKTIPMQWPLENEPGECTFETWIQLEGPAVIVRSQLKNARTDKTFYAARMQELPAVYVNAPYCNLYSYTGPKPFADDKITRIEYTPRKNAPWTSWYASENWSAQVNDKQFGLGVWLPGCYTFSGGFAGKPGVGGSKDNPTGYIAPNQIEHLDYNMCHEYEYRIIVGELSNIRKYVVDHSAKTKHPEFHFQRNRQSWHLVNMSDTGWPIVNHLHLLVEKSDPQLISPTTWCQADENPILEIEAAYKTTGKQGQVYWSTHADPGFGEKKSIRFPIENDGKFRSYEIRLADSNEYRGVIRQIRFDPVDEGKPGELVQIRSIRFRPRK